MDMRSNEAYEMAVKGELGPDGKSAPILTSLRCIHFQPPHFTLGKYLQSTANVLERFYGVLENLLNEDLY